LLLPSYGLRENEDVSHIPEHETGKPQRFELKQRPLMSAKKDAQFKCYKIYKQGMQQTAVPECDATTRNYTAYERR
jgi:hypothetical protein